jgi:hypothetical protein
LEGTDEQLRLNQSGNGYAHSPYMTWYQNGVRQAYMGWGTPGSSFDIAAENSNALNLNTGGTTRVTISSGGKVGIGTTAPQATLDVNGAIKLGTFTVGSWCSTRGTMGFDPNTNIPIFCNGSVWVSMWSGGGQFQVYLCDAWGNFHPSGVDCRIPNPLTGSCSCPTGLTAHATNDFNSSIPVSTCPQTYYEYRGMLQFSCD